MNAFQVGKTYTTRSACDHNTVFAMTVIKRTAKTITVELGGFRGTKNLRVKSYEDTETVKPYGSYSMAPVITAQLRG